MKISIIGLGRVGSTLAYRNAKGSLEIDAFRASAATVREAINELLCGK
ncbi:MAG: hypothetical protein ACREVJ_00020 [Gammaproteobacteria bacterium]